MVTSLGTHRRDYAVPKFAILPKLTPVNLRRAKSNPALHYVVNKVVQPDGTAVNLKPPFESSKKTSKLPILAVDTFYDNAPVHFFCSVPQFDHVPVKGGKRANGEATRLDIVH